MMALAKVKVAAVVMVATIAPCLLVAGQSGSLGNAGRRPGSLPASQSVGLTSAEAPTTAPTAADLTVRPGDGVGGVKIGMLMTDVERVLGAPTRKVAPSGTIEYLRLGMVVIPKRGTNRVGTIVGERPKTLPAFTGLTAEALGIGSTRKQIVAVYGEPDHATTKPGTTFENLRYDGRGISWTLNEGQCIQVAVMAGTRTAATRP